MTLYSPQARQRVGRTIIANFLGCALLVIGVITTPVLVGLGFAILVVSFAVRLYVLVTSKRSSPRSRLQVRLLPITRRVTY